MARKTDPTMLDNAVGLYLSGKSAYEIAATAGVDRGALKRELIARGIEPRGRSSAGLNRTGKMTPAERAAQAAAAHHASRGRKAGWDERCKSALSRQKNPPAASGHEQRFATWLEERHIPYRRETAIGAYNVDFTIGPIAVEILGGEWHLDKTERHARRTPYILGQGWAMLFVWATVNQPLTADAAEYAIAFADEASRKPPLVGEYRVIRGDSYLITSGRCDDGQFAGIPASRDRYDIPA